MKSFGALGALYNFFLDPYILLSLSASSHQLSTMSYRYSWLSVTAKRHSQYCTYMFCFASYVFYQTLFERTQKFPSSADKMKSFSLHIGVSVLLLGIALGLELEKRDCAADNCLRQVQATRPAAQSHMASLDCSSYLAGSTTTVTYTPGLG